MIQQWALPEFIIFVIRRPSTSCMKASGVQHNTHDNIIMNNHSLMDTFLSQLDLLELNPPPLYHLQIAECAELL